MEMFTKVSLSRASTMDWEQWFIHQEKEMTATGKMAERMAIE